MNVDLLIATYAFVLPKKEAFASEFFSQLFIRSPEAYRLFVERQTDMLKQQQVLMSTLYVIVTGLKSDQEETIRMISALGKRHQIYGAPIEFYDLVGSVLINTLKTFLKDAWTPEKEASWTEAYALIKKIMISAYDTV